MNNSFKYFIKIEKSTNQNGDLYVQGVASGTLEDDDSQRMSVDVIKAFADSINTRAQSGNPLPLSDAHPKAGPILGDLGEVIEAKVLDDANHSLFIKAKLESDHPAVPILMKRLQQGKRFAFSIEGWVAKANTVFSQRLNKFVKEYQEVIPRNISITSEPSYTPSFMEVVSKAYDPETIDQVKENIEKAQELSETMQAVISSANINLEKSLNILKNPNIMSKSEDLTSTPTPTEEKVKDTVESVKTEEAPEAPKEVVSKAVDQKTFDENVNSVIKQLGDLGYIVTKSADPTQPHKDEVEAPKEPEIVKEVEESKEVEKSVDTGEIVTKSISEGFDGLKNDLKELTSVIKSVSDTQKSLHEDIEALKEMPLAKKSKVMKNEIVRKSLEDRKEDSDEAFIEKFKEVESN